MYKRQGVGQRETFIAGRVGRLQQNGEIQAAVIQPLGDVRGIGAVEMKPDVRILLLQGGSRCQKGVRGIRCV